MSDVVQKLWGFCHTLRHDGVDYGDYIEQITYLLFLKMADEKQVPVPRFAAWQQLRRRSGVPLLDYYAETLRKLGKENGMLGDIYFGAQSRINNPANLKKLVELINATQWTELDIDVKAEAYEGLLEKAASEGKKGAGQYFTPRILIKSIVRCMKPDPRASEGFRIYDPACGTGGFLVCAYEWLIDEARAVFDRSIAKRLRNSTYYGKELVPRPRRLSLMNLYLHGIEPEVALGDTVYEPPGSKRYDVVLTNPPFGNRGATEIPDREDFVVATPNKQLNFLQHVITTLREGGRAAVILPDTSLFADQAGDVFRVLVEDCSLHTVLRLPRGTFTPYSQGVKAYVIFFTKGTPTRNTWLYDARTNVPSITKKSRPLKAKHFEEFELCYGNDPGGRAKRSENDSVEGRWKKFTIEEIRERDYKIDSFRWLREEILEESDDFSSVDVLEETAAQFKEIVTSLQDLITLIGDGRRLDADTTVKA